MANITATMVKELREASGIGMMACKKALVESNGDLETAIENLRKASIIKAAAKSTNVTAEGLVATKIATNNHFGALIEVNCQTDFVARDKNFTNFVDKLLNNAVENKITTIENLVTNTLEKERQELIQKLGENINIRYLYTIDSSTNTIGTYVHTNGRIAVLIELSNANAELAKSIAMHIAAANPLVIEPAEISAGIIEKEKQIFIAQAAESGKPDNIIEKIVNGKIKKYVAENSLNEQAFIKDTDKTIGEILRQTNSKAISFKCLHLGQGIEKPQTDFAQEVRSSIQ